MDPNNPFPFDFGAMAGLGIIFFFVWLIFTGLLIMLAIWIQYTIMWRAMRRAMNEFHYGGKVAPQQQVAQPAKQYVAPRPPTPPTQ